MDLINAYQALNRSTLDVIRSVNKLTPVEEIRERPYVRLKENPFVLTEDIKRVSQVVTAHDLSQYRNKFYSIRLEEQAESGLMKLLNADKEYAHAITSLYG